MKHLPHSLLSPQIEVRESAHVIDSTNIVMQTSGADVITESSTPKEMAHLLTKRLIESVERQINEVPSKSVSGGSEVVCD